MTVTFRILITSSRNWDDPTPIITRLEQLTHQHPHLTIVDGAAPDGGDNIAGQWADQAHQNGRPITHEPHPAQWRLHGKPAGMIRNSEMVQSGADLCLAFIRLCTQPRCPRTLKLGPHGSHGATQCAKLARRAGIETRIIRWETRYE